MSAELLYFAYGSNLHPLRLVERTPSARSIGVAVLPGHELRFHKRGGDASGKCNAFASAAAGGLPGALYRLAAADKPVLDRFEGAGYRVAQVTLEHAGRRVEAFTYLAEPGWIDEALRPYHWYKALVAEGARFRGLPAPHLSLIEAVGSVDDADRKRAAEVDALLGRMRAHGAPGA